MTLAKTAKAPRPEIRTPKLFHFRVLLGALAVLARDTSSSHLLRWQISTRTTRERLRTHHLAGDLADAGARQLGHDVDDFRPLVADQSLVAEGFELGLRDGRAGLEDHERVHRFAPLRVGHADDRGIIDA